MKQGIYFHTVLNVCLDDSTATMHALSTSSSRVILCSSQSYKVDINLSHN